MPSHKRISFLRRSVKYAKKSIRIINVRRHKTNTCDQDKFLSISENPVLNSKLTEVCSGVYYWDGFLTEDECKSLISLSEPKLTRSSIHKGNEIQVSSKRTCYDTVVDEAKAQEIATKIRSSIAQLTGLPRENQELIKVIKYTDGQEFKLHHDCHHPGTKGEENIFFRNGGMRVFSTLLYLNHGYAGGRTIFPKLNLRCEPKTGRLLIWNNADGKDIKAEMIHSAEPIIEGEKWAATLWVRENNFNP